MWPNRGPPQGYGAPPHIGGGRPDFSTPPPGYHAGMPPPTFRPASGANTSALPPRPSSFGGGGGGTPGSGGGATPGGGGGPPPQGGQTTLFVGGISPGISDVVLEQLLNACGQLRNLKRVRNASGKPQPFGFAEFEDPDAVLRALVVLNGIELPNLESRSEPGKKLIVKADEKTRAFLDEYEKLMLRTDADDELEASSVRSITHILSSLTSSQPLPSAASTALSNNNSSAASSSSAPQIAGETPMHLRDLQPEDLSEDKRAGVLSQIGLFRGSQDQRERERRHAEEERERRRIEAMVREQARAAPSPAAHNPYTPQQGAQSYNKPVAFVPSGGDAPRSRWPNMPTGPAAQARERTDEEVEEERRERRRREQAAALRERERRLEQRERQRLAHFDRDAHTERARLADEKRAYDIAREREERWDSDEEEVREPWVVDRPRWRSQRALFRRREEEADAADAKAEAEEDERAAREAEALLARQAEELAQLSVSHKAAGILTDEVAPVKLSIGGAVTRASGSTHAGPLKTKAPPKGVAFEEEEEEESKKRRVLVKLDPLEGLQGEEREAKQRSLLAKIRSKVPSNKDDVFSHPLVWDGITESIVQEKLRPAARKKLESYLGDLEDEDLLNFALDHVRERKGPEELVEGLEPVLEDDALAFTIHFWRATIFESLAAEELIATDGVSL